MTVSEAILQRVKSLPEPAQQEVLDFVEHLEARAATATEDKRERAAWSSFSLSNAMRGMEDEPDLYTLCDLRESSHA